MKTTRLFGALLAAFAATLLAACGPPVTSSPEATWPLPLPTPESRCDLPDDPTHYGWILETAGPVSVRRAGASNTFPATPGVRLRQEDSVRVDVGGRAVISCGSTGVVRLEGEFEGTLPCAEARGLPPDTVLRTGQNGEIEFLHPARGPRDESPDYGNFPVLLAPRNTLLTESQPLLSWSPVAGATRYEVTIYTSGAEPWTAAVSTTSLLYPADAPPLAHNRTYSVRILAHREGEARPRPSAEDATFMLLTGEEAARIEEWARALRDLGLDEEAPLLAVGYSYCHGLLTRAGEQLDALLDRYPDAPALYTLRGGLYLDGGLLRPAGEAYNTAVALAEQDGDELALADALVGQGTVLFLQLRSSEATASWARALAIYQAQGETERARLVEAAIQEAQK